MNETAANVFEFYLCSITLLLPLGWSWRFGQVDLSNKDQTQFFRLETNAIMSKPILFHRLTMIRSIFITNKSGNRRFDKAVFSSCNTRRETTECYLSYIMIWVDCVFWYNIQWAQTQSSCETQNLSNLNTLCRK